ncbi:MAG: hypothetical protein J6J43_05350 [Oscillospiraceae bacterium]|nr:hypothetical protein [Oscillospiraceae bacterium]
MAVLLSVLETVLPVVLALIIGMMCREKKFISREGIDTLKKVVINITLPAVLVNALATAQYDRNSVIVPAVVFLACCLALVIGMGLSRLMKLGKLPAYLATGFECGMLGYALFALLFPGEATSHFAIPDLGQTVFVFTLYKALLSGKSGKKAVIRDILTSPIIWAIVAGVLLGATGLYGLMEKANISGVLNSLTSFISAPTGMIILLVVGYDLDLRQIKWSDTIGFIVLRLVTMGVVLAGVLLLNTYVLGGVIHTGAIILMFLLPPPYVLPIFSTDESQRARLSSAISALTLVTMILFAVMAAMV